MSEESWWNSNWMPSNVLEFDTMPSMSFNNFLTNPSMSFEGLSQSNSNTGSWLGNLLKPNTFNALANLGQVIGAIAGSGNKKPSFNYSPYQQGAAGGLSSLAGGGPFNQSVADQIIRSVQGSAATRGLEPGLTGGYFRNTLANAFTENALKNYMAQLAAYQSLGGLGGQGVVQQAATPAWANALQAINQIDQNAYMKQLLGNLGGQTSLGTSPFFSSMLNLFGV